MSEWWPQGGAHPRLCGFPRDVKGSDFSLHLKCGSLSPAVWSRLHAAFGMLDLAARGSKGSPEISSYILKLCTWSCCHNLRYWTIPNWLREGGGGGGTWENWARQPLTPTCSTGNSLFSLPSSMSLVPWVTSPPACIYASIHRSWNNSTTDKHATKLSYSKVHDLSCKHFFSSFST